MKTLALVLATFVSAAWCGWGAPSVPNHLAYSVGCGPQAKERMLSVRMGDSILAVDSRSPGFQDFARVLETSVVHRLPVQIYQGKVVSEFQYRSDDGTCLLVTNTVILGARLDTPAP